MLVFAKTCQAVVAEVVCCMLEQEMFHMRHHQSSSEDDFSCDSDLDSLILPSSDQEILVSFGDSETECKTVGLENKSKKQKHKIQSSDKDAKKQKTNPEDQECCSKLLVESKCREQNSVHRKSLRF
ncbi:hypothetical protein FQR65_LT02013 [Abscondita terminalis]|nr:hypothetical protein FQR65_LT02013 [Abscondita terminalis]